MCFPEYRYIFYTQTKLHSYKHTYSLTFIQIHISLLDFFSFYYKKQFDILLLRILCYTVRASSLLKSMHFLLVVSEHVFANNSQGMPQVALSLSSRWLYLIHLSSTSGQLHRNAFMNNSNCSLTISGPLLDTKTYF